MAELSARRFALWLSLTPGLGNTGIGIILTRIATTGLTPAEFIQLTPEGKRRVFPRIAKEAAQSLSRPLPALAEEYEAMEARLSSLGVEWVTTQDASYPARLLERLEAPPTVIYLYGNRALLERETFTAFASRRPPPRAMERLERAVEKWVLRPSVLVGGHSTPAYQRAAVVPLRWGTPRILVFDCGIFRALSDTLDSEPFRTARLWRYNFDPKMDLVVSESHPYGLAKGRNQPRDWLISALADELIFVAVREGGNMERIGLKAIETGRTVRVLEWPEYPLDLRGNRNLIAAGGKTLGVV